MDLSSQVVSLELARRLKELGVKQESLFYYVNNIFISKCQKESLHESTLNEIDKVNEYILETVVKRNNLQKYFDLYQIVPKDLFLKNISGALVYESFTCKMDFRYRIKEKYSAFTFAELWRCFPVYIGDYFLTIKMYGDNLFYGSYRNDKENLKDIAFVEKNGADALARMLIYLLENNLVKLEEVNERIK